MVKWRSEIPRKYCLCLSWCYRRGLRHVWSFHGNNANETFDANGRPVDGGVLRKSGQDVWLSAAIDSFPVALSQRGRLRYKLFSDKIVLVADLRTSPVTIELFPEAFFYSPDSGIVAASPNDTVYIRGWPTYYPGEHRWEHEPNMFLAEGEPCIPHTLYSDPSYQWRGNSIPV